jgi:drug/metabolite transporter (DMT)-like permease
VILAWLFLGEKLTKKEVAVFCVGLVGMGFVIRPNALLTWDGEIIQRDFGIDIETFVFGVFMAVSSTFCASVSTVVIRAVMTEQKEKSRKLKSEMAEKIKNGEKIDEQFENSAANIHWTVLIFHYSLLSILILYPYRIFQTGFSTEFVTDFIMNPFKSEIIYCFIVAFGGLMASSLNIFALRNTSVFNVSIVTSTLTIVFGFMFDYFLFGKVPSTNSLIGSFLIFLSVAVLMVMKR